MSVDITSIGLGVDTRKLTQGTRDLDNFGRSANKAANSADQSTKSMGAMTAVAGKLAIVLGAAGIASSLIKTIDSYTKYNAQLKLATQSQEQFNIALADVQRIAKTAQSDISSVATLYARLNSSLREVGVTQAQVARITENVGLALKVSGATASESSSAILQLSQAFASGVLRGEEFNAVSESAPALMRALADSIGVPIGALREMASEGEITSEVLNRAFSDEKLLAKFREQAKEVQTISGSFTQLKNSIMLLGGEIANQSGAGVSFAQILNAIATSIQSMANVIKGDLKGAFDSILPAYREFKILQDKEAKALPVARNSSGNILASGAKMGDFIRRDIGNITDVSPFAALKKEFDKFKSDNPLKDAKFANEEYAKSIKLIQDNVAAMNITPEEGKRYEAQLKKTLESATKVSGDLANKEKERRDDALKDLQFQVEFDQENLEAKNKSEFEALEKIKDTKEKHEKEIARIQDDLRDDRLREEKRALEELQREQERFAKDLSRSITDALFRGFESGKDFVKNFKDTVFNAFQTMVLRPRIEAIITSSGIAGSASSLLGGDSSDSAYGGDSSSLLGIGKNLFDGITKGFNTLNDGFITGVANLGNTLSDFGLDKIGSFISTNSTVIADIAPYAGAVLKLVQGDVKGAALTAVGTALGSYFGPVGGMIGGAIGSFVGGMLGGGLPPRATASRSSTYTNGTFSAFEGADKGKRQIGGESSLDALNKSFSQNISALLNAFGLNQSISTNSLITKKKNTRARFNASVDGVAISEFELGLGKKASVQDAFNALIAEVLGSATVRAIQASKLSESIKSLFNGLSDRTEVLNMINATISLNAAQKELANRFGLTVDNAADVSVATGLAGQSLVDFVNKLTSAANATKSVGDVLFDFQTSLIAGTGFSSLPTTLKAFDESLKGINKTTQEGIQEFSDLFSLREQFLAFTQQIDALKSGVKGSLFSIVSDAEKQSMLNADLAKLFGDLNREVPASIQELIALGKSIDFTTAEGLNLAAVFPSLVTAFNETKNAVDSLIGSLNPDRFRTFMDFAVASSYVKQGIPLSQLPTDNMPSYAVGTSYVPNDGIAMLHQGEAVLTSGENSSITMNSVKMVSLLESLNSKVSALEYDMKRAADGSQRAARELEDITGGDVTIQTQAA